MPTAKKAAHRHRVSTSQLLNFAKDSYLDRTSRPIYAVLFLLPFIVFYEVGTILINTDLLNESQVRVVAFVWLQDFFRYVGFADRVVWAIPPLVVVVVLVSLQIVSRRSWLFYPYDVVPMGAECVLLAVPLIVLSLFLNTYFHMPGWAPAQPSPVAATALHVESNMQRVGSPPGAEAGEGEAARQPGPLMASIVTSMGAGIYEELVFRLILICLLVILFQDVLGTPYNNALVLSVLISAGMFSAHHHVVFVGGQLGQGIPFSWTEFGFRTAAGVYFSVLFAVRGFGITAGTHVFYDILATLLNAAFFTR